jgi:transposase
MARQCWIGLDAGSTEVQVCVLGEEGKVLGESLLPSNADEILRFVDSSVPHAASIFAVEAGEAAIRLTRSLRAKGCEVAVLEAFQASRALGIRKNKTDANDARGLADIIRLARGMVREVFVKGPDCQKIRSQLTIRQNLVI